MKIGFVIDDGMDKPDGVQQYILTLGRYYESLGHEVRYLAGETKRTDLKQVYSMAKNVKIRFNGNALTIPLPTSREKIKKVLHDESFDVLHVQVPYSPFFGARVVKQAQPKTVVVGTFHILPYDLITRYGSYALGFVLARNLKRFDAMVGVSPPAVEFSESSFNIATTLSPNSVDMSLFKPASRKKGRKDLRILFLGRLVPRKGCLNLLEALALLKHNDRLPENVVVDICGDGALRSQLEQFVRESGLEEVVRFQGFVTHDEKVAFMQQADIAVFPSLSGESFGIVLIEAMAAGSGVVLAGNNPGYASVLGDLPGSMVDAKKPHVFAEQLAEMIEDPLMREGLHSLQQEYVKRFNTKVVGNQLLDLYESCKSKRNS